MKTSRGRHAAWTASCLLFLLAASIASLAGTSGVAGRVVDRSGDPVPGAVVTFTCTGGAAAPAVLTDENGRFLSPRLAEGECTIEASLPSMDRRTLARQQVIAGKVSEIELRLDVDMIREQVAVKGIAVRNGVESREIRESFSRDAGEALARVEGVRKIRKGGIANDVVVRGFKGENLNVLIDGQRIYGACPNRMDPPAFHVDFAEIERIDVKKGPFDMTSVGGLGGMVNVVTREPDAGVHATASVTAGSFDYQAPSLGASYASAAWSLKGGYASRSGDPFKDGEGAPFTDVANYQPSASGKRAFDIRTGWIGAAFNLRPAHRLEVQATRQSGNLQLYPYLLMDAEYDDADRVSASYRAQGPFGAVEGIEASASYARVDHYMTDALRTSAAGAARAYSMATEARSSVLGERIQAKLRHGLALGIEAYQRSWNTSTVMAGMAYKPQGTIPDVDVDSAGIYGLYDTKLSSKWRLEAGARLDRATSAADSDLANTDLYYAYHDTRSTSATDTLGAASMTATFSPAEAWELFGGLGRTERAPDPQERYFAQKKSGSDWVGNPALAPPRNTEADLGARFRSGGFSVEASVFYAAVNDFVAVTDTARVNEVAGVTNTKARSYVNNDARMRGGEATLRWAPTGKVAASLGVSYVRGEQDVSPALGITDPDLPEMAPLAARASLRYDAGKWFAEGEGVASAEQDRISSDLLESRTPGWGVLNLRGGALFRHFSIVAGATNVFDRYYTENYSYQRDPFRLGVVVPEPGRTFTASLQLRY